MRILTVLMLLSSSVPSTAQADVTDPSCRVSCGGAALVITSAGMDLADSPRFRNCLGAPFIGTLAVTSSTGVEGRLTVEALFSPLRIRVPGGTADAPSQVQYVNCRLQQVVPAEAGGVSFGTAWALGTGAAAAGEREVAGYDAFRAACRQISIECGSNGSFRHGAPIHERAEDEAPKSGRRKSAARGARRRVDHGATPAESSGSSEGHGGSAHD